MWLLKKGLEMPENSAPVTKNLWRVAKHPQDKSIKPVPSAPWPPQLIAPILDNACDSTRSAAARFRCIPPLCSAENKNCSEQIQLARSQTQKWHREFIFKIKHPVKSIMTDLILLDSCTSM